MIFYDLIQTASSLPTDASALESSISALEREVKALESSSVPWEYSVWGFTILVVLGVLMELWVIRHERRDDMEAWALTYFGVLRPLGRPSTKKFVVEIGSVLLIALGVAGELGAGIEIASINGALRGKSAELRSKSDQLLALVTRQAGDAKNSTLIAQDAATKAKDASASAVTTARGARLEADSFEADIKVAKEQAASAESHLADALERAAKAEAELNRLRTPRSLAHSDKLIAALKPFNGTEYTLNVFMDDESMEFTKVVAHTLETAGWVRKQPAGINLGIPTMRLVFDQGVPEYVPACVNTGISLRAHVKESLEVIQSRSFQSLPKTLQAALVLKSAIALSVSPLDERNIVSAVLDPEPGEGIPITICVGKKP